MLGIFFSSFLFHVHLCYFFMLLLLWRMKKTTSWQDKVVQESIAILAIGVEISFEKLEKSIIKESNKLFMFFMFYPTSFPLPPTVLSLQYFYRTSLVWSLFCRSLINVAIFADINTYETSFNNFAKVKYEKIKV